MTGRCVWTRLHWKNAGQCTSTTSRKSPLWKPKTVVDGRCGGTWEPVVIMWLHDDITGYKSLEVDSCWAKELPSNKLKLSLELDAVSLFSLWSYESSRWVHCGFFWVWEQQECEGWQLGLGSGRLKENLHGNGFLQTFWRAQNMKATSAKNQMCLHVKISETAQMHWVWSSVLLHSAASWICA